MKTNPYGPYIAGNGTLVAACPVSSKPALFADAEYHCVPDLAPVTTGGGATPSAPLANASSGVKLVILTKDGAIPTFAEYYDLMDPEGHSAMSIDYFERRYEALYGVPARPERRPDPKAEHPNGRTPTSSNS